MRIVDVNPYFYPFFGGIEHRMHLIAKELVSRGHEVIIVTGQLPGTEIDEIVEDGYRIVRLPSRYIKIYNPPYITSKGLLEKLNEIDADIVNFNYRWAPSYTKDMRKYAGKKVFTYHNMWGEGIGIQHTMSEINDNMFAQKISKRQQLSNWEADVLTDKQKTYAATDAWACIQIYNEIIRLRQTNDYKLIIKAEDKHEASISEKG